MNRIRRQKPKPRAVVLKNPLTNETLPCTIVDEEFIDGVAFWVVTVEQRQFKLNQSAYKIIHGK